MCRGGATSKLEPNSYHNYAVKRHPTSDMKACILNNLYIVGHILSSGDDKDI